MFSNWNVRKRNWDGKAQSLRKGRQIISKSRNAKLFF